MYPILWAIYPLLHFYFSNQHELSFPGWKVWTMLLGLTVLVIYTNSRIWGKEKGLLLTTLGIIWFFGYGVAADLVSAWQFKIGQIWVGLNKIWWFIGLFFFILPWCLKQIKAAHIIKINELLALTGVILVIFQALSWRPSNINKQSRPLEDLPKIATGNNNDPDIYYIILDMFAGEKTLANIYKYDNSGFGKFLTTKGFTVLENTASNYPMTNLSLASSLNLKYLEPKEASTTKTLINDSQIWKLAKNRGYKVINLAAMSNLTNRLTGVDENLACPWTDEIQLVFWQTTALAPIIHKFQVSQTRSELLCQFNWLPKIARRPVKKLVFAHLVLPHPPYVFNADGSQPNNIQLDLAGDDIGDKKLYLNQLIFTVNKTEEIISQLLANIQRPTVIILQSDHGPTSILGNPLYWKKPYDPAGISERLHILNAWYGPEPLIKNIYPGITPVNTFRVIFNYYFQTNLPLLPDKNFMPANDAKTEFIDVTGKF